MGHVSHTETQQCRLLWFLWISNVNRYVQFLSWTSKATSYLEVIRIALFTKHTCAKQLRHARNHAEKLTVTFGWKSVVNCNWHDRFTALRGMQTQSSDDNSVCLSIKRVHCDKKEERSVRIFIPYERPFSLVYWEQEWLVRRPLLLEILGQLAPLERNRRFWTDIRS